MIGVQNAVYEVRW